MKTTNLKDPIRGDKLDEHGRLPREPIAYVRAVVEFPLYEGDVIDRKNWNDFIYEEPGISPKGNLAVCRRECRTISAEVMPIPKEWP